MEYGTSFQISVAKIDKEIPILAKLYIQELPSLKIWVTRKFIELVKIRHLSHLFLKDQGTKEELEKASSTILESVSNYKEFQPLELAIFKLCIYIIVKNYGQNWPCEKCT